MTWRSERIVEVAIGAEVLAASADQRVLEVGNVMRQYTRHQHTVVDRYEVGPGVVNEDAETFQDGPFDAILSISTLEHIGWDEVPIDPGKIPRVIENLRRLLKPGGTMTVTVPHNWNHYLDEMLARNSLGFDRVSYLRRMDYLNRRWEQVAREDLAGLRYGYPFVGASAVAVATLTA